MNERFVLSKHESKSDFHIDFFVDFGGESLLTWKICDKNFAGFISNDEKFFNFTESQIGIGDTFFLNCQRIFDHRRKYLDFSGDLGDDRGRVTRIECGTWELLELNAHRLTIKTVGTRLNDNLPTVKQWQFEPPNEIELTPHTPLLEQLPPPGEGIWLVSCSFLC